MNKHNIHAPANAISFMYRMYRYILPEVKRSLDVWRSYAKRIPDQELSKQAQASIATKEFHCQGGSVYAAANISSFKILVPLIVAFQTISDYLDNLCDRSTSLDGRDFRMLHQSMLDAVNPHAPLQDYYVYHPEKDDGGYLTELVSSCQFYVKQLPSYDKVHSYIHELVSYYCDLQVYKHIQHKDREPSLLKWWEQYEVTYPDIRWNEFAAATGSTLGVFMLFLAASEHSFDEQSALDIRQAYFPYVCGLHILLDYFIDQEEDRIGGDLNFCNYYESTDLMIERIQMIADRAKNAVRTLPHSSYHYMIIEGLLAVYLSDLKVSKHVPIRRATKQLMKKSPMIRIFFLINSVSVRIGSYFINR